MLTKLDFIIVTGMVLVTVAREEEQLADLVEPALPEGQWLLHI